MRTTGARLALAGTLALTGLTGGVVLGPALATAATTEESAAGAVSNRVDRIKQALQGLVSDGTITEAQRDRVAETLAEKLPGGGHGRGGGPGVGHGRGQGPGGRLAIDVAAGTLGLTEQELLTELRAGKSLADVAGEQGVSVETLTEALVKAVEERLAEAVAGGKLTQEEADQRKADLAERIGDLVQRQGFPGRGPGGGPGRGWGPGGRPGAPDDDAEPEDAPSTEGSSYRS